MSVRVTTYFLAAAAAAMLAVSASVASASPATSATAKTRVVTIAMRDPGCHWFAVAGKYKSRLVVTGKTAFRNQDEAAVVFTGKSFHQRVAVGKTITISAPGTYHIVMVGQHADDNHLVLLVK